MGAEFDDCVRQAGIANASRIQANWMDVDGAEAVLAPYRPQRFAGLTAAQVAAATHPRAAKLS